MKILSIATTHPRFRGDSEPSFVFYLNRELVKRGHEVTTLVPHAVGARRRETVDGVVLKRFRYAFPASMQRLCYDGGILPNLQRSWVARFSLPTFLISQLGAIAKELWTRQYDLIHCHWLIPQGFFAAIVDKVGGLPLVVTVHGGDIFTENRMIAAMNRFVLKRCTFCTPVSRPIERRVRGLYAGVRSEVISMGVDLNQFNPCRRSEDLRNRLGGDPLLLFVGRIAEKKGVPYLLRAMPRILSRFAKARLVIIGSGPDETLVDHEIERQRLHDSVTRIGRVGQGDLPPYMASPSLFIMPSVVAESGDTEGLPVVLMEALASGVPVVASDVGGVADLIRHGETGLLAEQRNSEDLAEKCIRMLKDETLRRATVENARRLIDRDFSWPGVAERFERIFLRCVNVNYRS